MTVPNETDKAPRRAAVYRLYDAAGALLYIGSAYDPDHRSKKHEGKDWWPQVARREDEWHPSRQDAFAAETEAIAAERPPFNRISGPGAVLLPVSRSRIAGPVPGLEGIDAYIESLGSEPPEVRARRLTELLDAVSRTVRMERRRALLEMHEGGMTYREIAASVGVSFGRVRQILADEEPAARPA